MKNIIKSLKKILPYKKEPTAKELFDRMDKLLNEAEEDFGGNVFPKENDLSTEDVHLKALGVTKDTSFEVIKENYAKLKMKYNPEKYVDDEIKRQKAIEADNRIDIAYDYFKKKFKIDN